MQHQDSSSTRCALLLRESSRAGAAEALKTQEFLLQPVAALRGYGVVAIYRDDGYSGELSPLERPAVRECLADAEQGLFTVVLMTDLDRAFRGEPWQYYLLKLALDECGVRLEFAEGTPEDDGSETGALLHGISLLLPSIKKRSTVKKLRAGLDRALAEGRVWASNPPYGYTYTPGPRGSGRWEIREDEAYWLRRIFEQAALGWSLGRIGRWLHAQGAPTRRGGQWWNSTLRSLLGNPKYCGRFGAQRLMAVRAQRPYKCRPTTPQTGRQGKARRQLKTSQRLRPRAEWGPEKEIPALALVAAPLWEHVQAQLRQNAAVRAARSPDPSPLYGLVFCAHDHGTSGPQRMYHDGRTGTTRPAAWRCHWRPSPAHKKCSGYANARKLEAAVLSKLRALATQPEVLLADYKAGLDRDAAWYHAWTLRLAAVDAQIAQTQTALDAMALDYYSRQLPPEQYARLKPVAEARLAAAQQARSALWAEREPEWRDEWCDTLMIETLAKGPDYVDPDGEPSLWPGFLRELEALELDRLGTMPPEERRQRLRQLVDRIVIDAAGASLILVGGGTAAPLRMGAVRSLYVARPWRLVLPLDLAA